MSDDRERRRAQLREIMDDAVENVRQRPPARRGPFVVPNEDLPKDQNGEAVMSDEALVDETAAWLLALWEESGDPAGYIDWARGLLMSSPRDEPHSGDCTDVPMTCNRCLTDDCRGQAATLLAAIRPAIERAALERAAVVAEGDADWSAFGKTNIEPWDTGPDAIRDYRLGIATGRAIAARIRSLIPKEEGKDG